jgi:hypothetical protein
LRDQSVAYQGRQPTLSSRRGDARWWLLPQLGSCLHAVSVAGLGGIAQIRGQLTLFRGARELQKDVLQ